MTFIVNYEIGSVAFTLMVTVVGLQFGLFTEAFFLQLSTLDWAYVSLDIYSLIAGLYAVAAVLISFGAVIGKVRVPFLCVACQPQPHTLPFPSHCVPGHAVPAARHDVDGARVLQP